jgi:uncharacterized protein
MRGLKVLLLGLVLAAAASHARADEPSPEAIAAATELFSVISPDMTRQMTTQISNAFWPAVVQMARARKIDDATVAEMRADFERIQSAFLADAMKDAPAIYARHFTVPELHELSAFYRTPIGAKALREMPQVTGEFMTTLVPRMKGLQQQVTESFEKTLREHGYAK